MLFRVSEVCLASSVGEKLPPSIFASDIINFYPSLLQLHNSTSSYLHNTHSPTPINIPQRHDRRSTNPTAESIDIILFTLASRPLQPTPAVHTRHPPPHLRRPTTPTSAVSSGLQQSLPIPSSIDTICRTNQSQDPIMATPPPDKSSTTPRRPSQKISFSLPPRLPQSSVSVYPSNSHHPYPHHNLHTPPPAYATRATTPLPPYPSLSTTALLTFDVQPPADPRPWWRPSVSPTWQRF